MKKYYLLILIGFFILFSNVFAAETFFHPVIRQAYEQVNLRIDQKASVTTLDIIATVHITQNKQQLTQILHAIDIAFQKRDMNELKKQAILFRNIYKETMSFLQNIPPAVVVNTYKNIPKIIAGDTEITGESVDITYYADNFEGGGTANGNIFSQSSFSAARCKIPFNKLIQVWNGNTSVVVKANDRPNCSRYTNVIDLSTIAFQAIGDISSGRLHGTTNILGMVSADYTKRMIPSDTFESLGITLDSNIPNTYLKNETFHITGKELFGKEYSLLYLQSPTNKDIALNYKQTSDGRFEYNFSLEETGVYKMVITSGLGFGTNTFVEIVVLDDTIFSTKKLISPIKQVATLKTLDVERKELPNGVSLYLFHFPENSFHTLILKSQNASLIYRGFGTIAIQNSDLKSFDTSIPVSIEISSAESSTSFSHDTYTLPATIFQKDMMLVPGYKTDKNENITINEIAGNLIIHGIIAEGKNVKSTIDITLPNGDVKTYSFDANSIDTDGYVKRGKIFEKSIPLIDKGLYHVEINYNNGFAAYNGPLIYGDFLPVYPNDLDTAEKNISNNDSSIVVNDSLNFVNAVRAKSGKSALVLDTNLNTLATIKANDMANHNIISHTDSYGTTISGTAKRNGIQLVGSVGENVAGGTFSFKYLLVGLANSGGHRFNMLDTWTKMGVGYAVKDGTVYYAQLFGE